MEMVVTNGYEGPYVINGSNLSDNEDAGDCEDTCGTGGIRVVIRERVITLVMKCIAVRERAVVMRMIKTVVPTPMAMLTLLTYNTKKTLDGLNNNDNNDDDSDTSNNSSYNNENYNENDNQ